MLKVVVVAVDLKRLINLSRNWSEYQHEADLIVSWRNNLIELVWHLFQQFEFEKYAGKVTTNLQKNNKCVFSKEATI